MKIGLYFFSIFVLLFSGITAQCQINNNKYFNTNNSTAELSYNSNYLIEDNYSNNSSLKTENAVILCRKKLKLRYKLNGYYGFFENLPLEDNSNNMSQSQISPSFLIHNELAFESGISTGISTGLEIFSASFVPILLQIKYEHKLEKMSPYIFVSGGYSFCLSEKSETQNFTSHTDGKEMFYTGIGVAKYFESGFGIHLGLAYRYHVLYQELTYNWWQSTVHSKTYYTNRMVMQIGISF